MAHLMFIHGIGNKPEAKELLKIWRRSLAQDGEEPGINLKARGVQSSLLYWADVMYEEPDPDVARHEMAEGDEPNGVVDAENTSWKEIFESAHNEQWMRSLVEEYNIDSENDEEHVFNEAARDDFERIPLPWAVKRPFMKLFVRDTHHYLFNKEFSPRSGTTYQIREEIRARFVDALKAAAVHDGPLVVVAHSQGTIIAYDCLKNVPECPQIDELITVGSPLGIDEVQDKLTPHWTRSDGFPSGTLKGGWANVYDSLDIVSRPDPRIANDFRKSGEKTVEDLRQSNSGLWRHAMTGYLKGKHLRQAVKRALF